MPATPPLLEIKDLHVSAEDGAILRGVDLTVGRDVEVRDLEQRGRRRHG